MRIRIEPYNEAWPALYESEASRLSSVLGKTLDQIHHIGSTAVPGLGAKPIIDILLEVRSLEKLDLETDRIEHLGYEAMGEFGIKDRRYFRKGGDERTHHIHAFQSGDPNVVRHIAFRDYLRAHRDVAQEYETLKREVAAACENSIERYGDGKDAFVRLHEARALEWVKSRRVPCDAGGGLPQS